MHWIWGLETQVPRQPLGPLSWATDLTSPPLGAFFSKDCWQTTYPISFHPEKYFPSTIVFFRMKQEIPFNRKLEKNEIMPFAATQMDLEIIILSEPDRERQISYDITYMWNLKYDTNELIYKTETDSQTWKTNLWLPKGKGVDKLGVWD